MYVQETRRQKRPATRVRTAALLALAGVLVGCNSHRPTDPTIAGLGPVPTTRLSPVRAGGPLGSVVTVPTESGVRPISPSVDLGTQVIITPSGFEPRILISNYDLPITWTNLTTAVQMISFLGPTQSVIASGPIQPGAKWTYTARYGGGLHVENTYGDAAVVDFQ